tara:strand:+ start:3306 stop:4025 length:720 start_codon:yes stop_codon:yes gene_type:complete
MNILVIGDSCLDKFIYGNVNRICPEAPVPIFEPLYSTTNDGMAANVANNLRSLGASVYLITNKNKIIKTRYIDDKSGQMLIRVDDEDSCGKIEKSEICFKKYDALVISDYDKGFLDKDFLQNISDKTDIPKFIDTKKNLGSWCGKFNYLKVNELEWSKRDKSFYYENAIVTKGSSGASYKDKVYPVDKKVNVSNVSGAGDTFLASLVFEYLKKGDIIKAIKFANFCASKVVQSRGVTTI